MLRFLASTATSYFVTTPEPSKELVIATTSHCYTFQTSLPQQGSEGSDDAKYKTIHAILAEDDFYAVLGITPLLADDENTLRRAYLSKSRQCHPDKFPEYPDSTLAFQKVSFAYTILSNPSSRKAYDLNPSANPDSFTNENAHDTFDGLLQLLFIDFMSGDFEMVRILLRTMKEVNPALRMEDDSVESIIAGFRRVREVVLGTRTYVRVLRRELLHMHDIQYSMRQLPYLAISSRLRLSLKFTRVFLSLPMAIDRAIEAEEAEKQRRRAAYAVHGEASANAQVGKRSNILGPKIGGLVNFLVFALEKSESVL